MKKQLFSAVIVTLSITCIFPFGFHSCQDFLNRVDPPRFSPPGGIYYSTQNVTISCKTAGAKIRYSYDPSFSRNEDLFNTIVWDNPKEHSIIYDTPIIVNSSLRIRAQAFRAGMSDSPEIWVTYQIHYPLPTPKFSIKSGIYITPQIISIISTSIGTIRYTTDGSEPTENSSIYISPITINATTFFKAKAFQQGYPESATANGNYSILELGKRQDN